MSVPDDSWLWIAIGVTAVGTYALRISFLAAFARYDVPPRLERGLTFVPPAVLAAIVAPAFLTSGSGTLALAPGNPKLLTGVVAAVVAWRTENVGVTVAVGLLAFWALSFLLP